MEHAATRAAPDLEAEGIETRIEDVLGEISRRARRAGALYPFEVDLRGVQRRDVGPEVELLYRFLALSSLVPHFRQNRTGFQPGRIFERIAAKAIERYSSGTAVVFGDIDKSGVRERIRELGRMLNVSARPELARPSRQDHGLDIAAWRTLGDYRSAHPVLLCQCTLKFGGPELVLKARDVQPGEWGRMLDVREGTVSAALIIPHVLEPGYEHWEEIRSNTDLIIERVRLLRLLADVENPAEALAAGRSFVNDAFQRWITTQSA